MKRIAVILTLLLGAMIETAVIAQDDMGAAPATAVDVVVENEDFSMLAQALEPAGLVDTLQAKGPFAVFADTLDGSDLEVSMRMSDKPYLDGSAPLTTVEFETGNGFVHVFDEFDEVLVPRQDAEVDDPAEG